MNNLMDKFIKLSVNVPDISFTASPPLRQLRHKNTFLTSESDKLIIIRYLSITRAKLLLLELLCILYMLCFYY